MSYKPVQLLQPHSATCAMLNGLNGDQPWCLPEQVSDSLRFGGPPKVGRDLAGRNNPRAQHTWMVFQCSDANCPAQLAIYWLHAEKLLGLAAPEWKLASPASHPQEEV